MVLVISGKLVCIGGHFKYYFFLDNFCFKQPLVLKIDRGMFFQKNFFKKFKNDIEIAIKLTGFEL